MTSGTAADANGAHDQAEPAFLGGEDVLNTGAHPGTGGAATSDVRRHLAAPTQSERPRFGHREADASDVMVQRLVPTWHRDSAKWAVRKVIEIPGEPADTDDLPPVLKGILDRHGILDADYEETARHNPRFQKVLLPDRTPTPLAGSALVVIDSSEPR